MRFLIVNADYPAFLESLYAQQPGLAEQSYASQLRTRVDSLFGTADFYPRNLQALGHEAMEVHVNNWPLQAAWAAEQGLKVAGKGKWHLSVRRGILPWVHRDQTAWMKTVLASQIEEFHPDVIVTHAVTEFEPRFWTSLKGQHRLLIGQIASPLSPQAKLDHFDIMLSSLQNLVERFRGAGINAELFRLGFDPSVLDRLDDDGPAVHVSFVGSLTADHHGGRLEWLEALCREVNVQVWGPGVDSLPPDSPIRRAYRGTAWGIEMYRVLRQSRVTLNHHIGMAGAYANNMRLYEATGVGTCLVTDFKDNLADLFEPNQEIAAYRSRTDCLEQIRYFLDHEQERRQMAAAGQQRTLRDHTYRQRMGELVAIVSARL